jgi:hypothetical protein
MIYYIVPTLIWTIFCTWKALHEHKELKLLDYVFALPLILLAVLRGEVGGDTPTYIANAQGIIWWNGQRTIDVEFGYVLLVRLVAIFTSDPRLVVAVISLLAAILFFLMLYMWENGQCIISLILIPLCFFYFTMNVLRVGIAFPLAAIAILQLEKKRFTQFYILALASICIQMTAAILLPMLLLARLGAKVSLKGVLYGLITGALILYLGYYIFGDRIAYKFLVYSIGSSLESNRSTGPLIISFVCSIIAIWFCEKRHRYLGLIFLVIQVAFFGIAQLSIGGDRLLTMELFAQLLALSYCAKRPINRGQLAIVLFICCLAFSVMARNFIIGASEPSGFIPYHFVWESR